MRMTGFLELLRYWLSTLIGAETLARTVWWERPSLTAYGRGDIAALHECRVEMTLHTKSAAHSGHADKQTHKQAGKRELPIHGAESYTGDL